MWWRVRTLTSGSGDISFLSDYAIIFYNLKQLSLFLQALCLGKLKGVSQFCNSTQNNMFIAINTVYLLLLQLEVKLEELWDDSSPPQNISISGKKPWRCPCPSVMKESSDWTEYYLCSLGLCYFEDVFVYLFKCMKLPIRIL